MTDETSEATPFSIRAEILAELWLNYRDDEDFSDFIDYNDIGMPMAYAVANGLAETTSVGERFIDETFALLLEALEVQDVGYEDLEQLLNVAELK